RRSVGGGRADGELQVISSAVQRFAGGDRSSDGAARAPRPRPTGPRHTLILIDARGPPAVRKSSRDGQCPRGCGGPEPSAGGDRQRTPAKGSHGGAER